MLRALERYDEAAGVPFPALASWWIRNALQELRSDFVRPSGSRRRRCRS
jgi:DNA-directed RNA polymerase sigma subunit (sigma70/sigma32)